MLIALVQDAGPTANFLLQFFKEAGANGVLLFAVWWMINRQDRRHEKQEERWDVNLKNYIAMEATLSEISASQVRSQDTQVKMQDTQVRTLNLIERLLDRIDRIDRNGGKVKPDPSVA
jgi:hypothetical protein